MTNVTLTDEEALMFIAYQKHHDLFCIMENVGAFDVGFGKVVLNIAGGIVQNIQREEVVYKR